MKMIKRGILQIIAGVIFLFWIGYAPIKFLIQQIRWICWNVYMEAKAKAKVFYEIAEIRFRCWKE